MRHVFALVLLCTLFASTGWAASPQSIEAHQKIHPSLSDKFAAKGDLDKVRVIVSLSKTQPKGLSKAQAIAEAQGRVIGAFKNENNGAGLKVLTRYQTLFGFSAELNRGQANALAKRGDIEFIEEMPVHQKLYPESHPLTQVNLAQNDYDGTGAVIAIIDDGIDASHPAFTGKLLGGYDFSDNDSDPTIGCADQSHGTAVAGVALGNGGGALGVAPGAKMVFLKIQSSRRRVCGGSALDGDIVGAIDWVTANKDTYGIDIISMSLGGGLFSSASSCDSSLNIYREAIENATDAGITVIAASGNDGMCDSMSRPACFTDVISVGAVYDENLGDGWGWCISNNSCANPSYNPGCPTGYGAFFEEAIADNVIVYSNSASFLDVAAPATCALSAAPGGDTVECFGGTSSATPFTSGAAALAVEAAGKGVLSPDDMRYVLTVSGDPVNDPKNGRVTPRVNGLGVVIEAAAFGGTNISPTAAFTANCSDLVCSFDGSASNDPDGSIASFAWTFGDGATASGETANHTYSSSGDYTVTLTVTDSDQASASTTQEVIVTTTNTNQDPVASFTSSCNDLTCNFDASASNDPDGSIASFAWTFDDGATASGETASHTYSAGGSYDVMLTVTDNDQASDSSSQTVTVTAPDPGNVTLVTDSFSVRNKWTATVEWSDGSSLSGIWSTGATCTEKPVCELSGIAKKVGSVSFTADNNDSVTITKP